MQGRTHPTNASSGKLRHGWEASNDSSVNCKCNYPQVRLKQTDSALTRVLIGRVAGPLYSARELNFFQAVAQREMHVLVETPSVPTLHPTQKLLKKSHGKGSNWSSISQRSTAFSAACPADFRHAGSNLEQNTARDALPSMLPPRERRLSASHVQQGACIGPQQKPKIL